MERTPLAQLSAYRSESLSANMSAVSEASSVNKATPLSDNTAGTPDSCASFPSGIDPDDAYSSSDESDSDDGAELDDADQAIVDAAVARVTAEPAAAEAHPPDVGASAANVAVRTQIRAARAKGPAEREGVISQAEVAATRAELEEAKLASLFEGLGCGDDDAPSGGD